MDKLFYLLRFFACSSILLLFYVLVLSRLKCFRFNRFYLLLSVLFSTVVPVVTLQVKTQPDNQLYNTLIQKTTRSTNDNNMDLQIGKPTNEDINVIDKPVNIANINQPTNPNTKRPIHLDSILCFSYWTISSLIFIQLIISLFIIYKKIQSNPKTSHDRYTFVHLDHTTSPYTFLHYIFIDKKEFEHDGLKGEVLLHEQQHARELHALDLLLIRILIVFGWVNPLLFLYQKFIRENHEYLADNAAIAVYPDKIQYQYLLLEMQQQPQKTFTLSNNFNFLTIKKRLTMINRTNKPIRNFILGLLSLPLLLGCVVLFAQRKYDNPNQLQNSISHTSSKDTINGISQKEFDYYIAEMSKGNYKFDPKNRQRDWFSELKNSPQGDKLIQLFQDMTWQQKQTTTTKYHLFRLPYSIMDSLSTTEWNTYNTIVGSILTDQQKKERDKFGHKTYRGHKDSATTHIYFHLIGINDDDQFDKYGYLNLMMDYMSQNQIDQTPYIVHISPALRKPQPVSPTEAQINKWSQHPELWGIWVDGKRISNVKLTQYKSSDIYYYSASSLAANAQKLDGFKVQLDLKTKKDYNAAFRDWK